MDHGFLAALETNRVGRKVLQQTNAVLNVCTASMANTHDGCLSSYFKVFSGSSCQFQSWLEPPRCSLVLVGSCLDRGGWERSHAFIQFPTLPSRRLQCFEDFTISAEIAAVQAVSQGWFADPTNPAVWKQQYLFNDQFYGVPGSPVFLYSFTSVARTLLRVSGSKARKIDNVKYLHSEPALADVATIQDYFIQAKNQSKGGSYPGSLAAWLKLSTPLGSQDLS
ncbi:hypothetical protein Ae201684P_003784 [Aphanomyces euteiches]|nr:hypothetical protein Ae201684P_003784 [Aphanomyces euteiches]